MDTVPVGAAGRCSIAREAFGDLKSAFAAVRRSDKPSAYRTEVFVTDSFGRGAAERPGRRFFSCQAKKPTTDLRETP